MITIVIWEYKTAFAWWSCDKWIMIIGWLMMMMMVKPITKGTHEYWVMLTSRCKLLGVSKSARGSVTTVTIIPASTGWTSAVRPKTATSSSWTSGKLYMHSERRNGKQLLKENNAYLSTYLSIQLGFRARLCPPPPREEEKERLKNRLFVMVFS